MKIIAIDFETADYRPDSACALAMVCVVDGTIKATTKFLIRPPREVFIFSYIHGITWEQVRKEKTFAERAHEVDSFIEDADYLAAHNASFDRRVMLTCYVEAGLVPPDIPILCTVKLARSAWDIRPTKLPDVCDYLGIELNHHDALSDAHACARIIIAADQLGFPAEIAQLGPLS